MAWSPSGTIVGPLRLRIGGGITWDTVPLVTPNPKGLPSRRLGAAGILKGPTRGIPLEPMDAIPARPPDDLLRAAEKIETRLLTPPVVLPMKLARQLAALCRVVHGAGGGIKA